MPLQVQAERVEIALGEAAPTGRPHRDCRRDVCGGNSGTHERRDGRTCIAGRRRMPAPGTMASRSPTIGTAGQRPSLDRGPRGGQAQAGASMETYRELAGEIQRKVIAAQAMRDKSALRRARPSRRSSPRLRCSRSSRTNFGKPKPSRLMGARRVRRSCGGLTRLLFGRIKSPQGNGQMTVFKSRVHGAPAPSI